MRISAVLALLTLCAGAQAQPQTPAPTPTPPPAATWRDAAGQPIEESEALKSKDDFGAAIAAITDEDWKDKWATPPESRPAFTPATVVPYGKKVFVLTFFTNPRMTASEDANVRCDYKLIDPNGKEALSRPDLSCFAGRLPDAPTHMYLSEPVIVFKGDPGDAAGTWVVQVTVRDVPRKVELALRSSFRLE